ncbi:MAG: restriction endonuclease [Clostridia bacterium]|nr:restriction endonuclease [Clostridia bacterium]
MKILKNILLLPITLIKTIKNGIENLFLSKYLKQFSINKIDAISGYEFEKYLECLFKSMGLKTTTTKKAHDYGADLITTYKKEVMVVQAKLYYCKHVGLSAIQEAKTSLDYYKADKAIVITNSYFTKSAINLAKSTGVALIDREKLNTLINANKTEKKALFRKYIAI